MSYTILPPAEKHLPNAVIITVLPDENKPPASESLLGLQAQLVVWVELKAVFCLWQSTSKWQWGVTLRALSQVSGSEV